MKRYSTEQVTREFQIKTRMRYTTYISWDVKIHNHNTKCWQGCGGIQNLFFFFSWWECKVIQLWLFLTKWHMLLLYDPAIVYTGIYPSELKNHVHTKTYTRIFIGALFIIDKPGSNQDVFQLVSG